MRMPHLGRLTCTIYYIVLHYAEGTQLYISVVVTQTSFFTGESFFNVNDLRRHLSSINFGGSQYSIPVMVGSTCYGRWNLKLSSAIRPQEVCIQNQCFLHYYT